MIGCIINSVGDCKFTTLFFIYKNISILPNIKDKIIKNKKYKIIEGVLTYIPDFCPCCGCVNESHNDITKWRFRKNCKIKISKISVNVKLFCRFLVKINVGFW